MKWYVAKLVFKICNGGRPQFDEHLRLIEASNFEEAFLKARMLGLREEVSFLTDSHQPVRWEFVNVPDLYPISCLADGIELHSNIREEDQAEAYVRSVHQKAVNIQLRERPAF